jgi:hypothetical protein
LSGHRCPLGSLLGQPFRLGLCLASFGLSKSSPGLCSACPIICATGCAISALFTSRTWRRAVRSTPSRT